MQLTRSQQLAIDHVDGLAEGPAIDRSLRITLNFHPDRARESLHILDSMAETGVYKSQFETRTSNGGLTAHPGGDRWRWESRIFGTAYDNAAPNERPKYGALNYRRNRYGGSPRFGSAHLRLTEDTLDKATFCYPDSAFEPKAFGTSHHMLLIELALADNKDLLDDYIEAQIHGELRLAQDVEALVLDPSYKGTRVEQLASQLDCNVEWHDGFVLSISEMEKYPEYRGTEYIKIGREIAQNGILTPHIIGIAAESGKYDQQDLKRVWHYLARFGQK
ncbi:MAG TPA: DUF3626 domain-containing protein [Candidatus Saccharimonadales bacterium]|nr:DUF3626 domain-containing protein [Candidatus Saccharimonadales bacterium]